MNNAHISLYGTVLQDPTSRQVNNSTVVTLRVAVTTTKKQENSQYPATDVYEVSVWNKAGESVLAKAKAKSKVIVHGDFMLGEPWQDRNGKWNCNMRVNANSVMVLPTGQVQATTDEEEPF